jgi:hypothetical protein
MELGLKPAYPICHTVGVMRRASPSARHLLPKALIIGRYPLLIKIEPEDALLKRGSILEVPLGGFLVEESVNYEKGHQNVPFILLNASLASL